MAGHAIWTGAINFGLVSIPVKLQTAVREHTLHFHFLHGKDGGRVNNVRRCSVCGKEIGWTDIERGFEVSKGKTVKLTDKDFERVDVEATQSVDICEFVDEREIDPMLYDRPYYLEPDKKGMKAYALLREALRESGRVGIARVVIRAKEHLAAVRVDGDALVLEMMHYADEIVSPKNLSFPTRKEAPRANEMKAARLLIDAMKATFEPEKFHDKYAEELRALIAKKAKGETIAAPKGKPKPTSNVIDLVGMLQESLAHTTKHRGPANDQTREKSAAKSAKKTSAGKRSKTATKSAGKTAKKRAKAA